MVLAIREAFAYEGEVENYRRRAEFRGARSTSCVVRPAVSGCGTSRLRAPQFVFIAAGTLDDPSWAVPTSHIWTEVASPGVSFHDDAIAIEGQPSDRQILIDAFNRVYPIA